MKNRHLGSQTAIKTIIQARQLIFNFLIAVFFCLANIESNGQNIGIWNFNGTNTGTPGTNNTISAATFSAAIPTRAYNGGAEYYGQNGWPGGGINTAAYMEFTLTPNAGHVLNVISLVLRMRRSNTAGGSGPTGWSIRSSLDGFASNLSSGTMTDAYANYTINPGAAFTSLPTAITFRVYGYNMTIGGGGGISRFVYDNIQVTGLGVILPVHFVSFTAQPVDNKIHFRYSLRNTEPGDVYTIERSTNSRDFSAVHSITVTNSHDQFNYDDNDNFPPAFSPVYYRLHIQTFGGASVYSPIVAVNTTTISHPITITITGNQLFVAGINGSTEVCLFNGAGSCVFRRQVNGNNSQQTLIIPALSPGIYFASVLDKKEKHSMPVLVK